MATQTTWNIFQAVRDVLYRRKMINFACASQTLTAKQTGQIFIGAVDAIFTLPAASVDTKGVWYTFVTGVASSGTGLSLSPNANDKILWNAKADDADLVNSGASDVAGDTVTVVCDGVDGWLILEKIGTWA